MRQLGSDVESNCPFHLSLLRSQQLYRAARCTLTEKQNCLSKNEYNCHSLDLSVQTSIATQFCHL